MNDIFATNVGESPEHIAFRLFEVILNEEKARMKLNEMTRAWVLDTYSDCLKVVKNPLSSKPMTVTPEALAALAKP